MEMVHPISEGNNPRNGENRGFGGGIGGVCLNTEKHEFYTARVL